jgi:hypothetical protein
MAKSQVHPRCGNLRREREQAGFTQTDLLAMFVDASLQPDLLLVGNT